MRSQRPAARGAGPFAWPIRPGASPRRRRPSRAVSGPSVLEPIVVNSGGCHNRAHAHQFTDSYDLATRRRWRRRPTVAMVRNAAPRPERGRMPPTPVKASSPDPPSLELPSEPPEPDVPATVVAVVVVVLVGAADTVRETVL